nr:interleukin-17B isoform X1 [Paramormyrops kingsleyae]
MMASRSLHYGRRKREIRFTSAHISAAVISREILTRSGISVTLREGSPCGADRPVVCIARYTFSSELSIWQSPGCMKWYRYQSPGMKEVLHGGQQNRIISYIFIMVSVCIHRVFFALLIYTMAVLEAQTESRGGRKDAKRARRRHGRIKDKIASSLLQNITSQKSSPDPIMAGVDGGLRSPIWEEDFEKSIEEMVAQVRNNSALSKNKCVVDRQLWMSNTRSLSPWSYRINHDENRIPVDIPEAKCSCAGCINPFTMQEDRTMTSVLIYTKIPVRRRLCDRLSVKHRKKKKCLSQYKTVVESIAVGCTCIV